MFRSERNNTVHNILVWLGRMKLKKMRLKYSKRTHAQRIQKKNTFAFIHVGTMCAWVCVFFMVVGSRQAKASHY